MQSLIILPNCGCSDPSKPDARKFTNICHNRTLLECVKSEKDKFDKNNIALLCDSKCPLECDSIVYETSVNTATYPSDYYIKILKQQNGFKEKFKNYELTNSLIKSSILMLTVYYKDLRYTFIEENPAITFDTIVGIVGGEFGFFIGASLLSFVEIFETFAKIFILFIGKYKKLNFKM